MAELPDFIVVDYLADGCLEALLPNWRLPGGVLSFVTPTAQARLAKVEIVAEFFADRLPRNSRMKGSIESRNTQS